MQVEKEWAKDLTQVQFEQEYIKKHPFTDVVPDVKAWLVQGEPQYHGIEMPVIENLMSDVEETEAPPPPKIEEKPEIRCECGRKFGVRVALEGHKRHCPMVKARIEEEKIKEESNG